MRRIIYTLIVFSSTTFGIAQDLSSDFYSYTLNMFNVNPAYTGSEASPKIMLNTRQPVRAIAGSPKNNMFGFHGKAGVSQGIGAKLISDARGPFSSVRGDFMYSYALEFNQKSTLRMGLSIGFINRNFESNRIENYELLDQTDPNLQSQFLNSTRFTAGYGMLFQNERFTVSASLPHFLEASQDFNFFSHYMAKVRMKASPSILIEPWIVYQHLPVTQDLFGGFLKGTYKDRIWLQGGISTNKTASAAIGINFWLLNVGYGYQIPNGQLNQISMGNHQIYLALNLKSSQISAGNRQSSLGGQSAELTKVLLRLEELLEKKEGELSQEDLSSELEKIRKELNAAQKMNSDPEKVSEVEFLLEEIAKKITELEERRR